MQATRGYGRNDIERLMTGGNLLVVSVRAGGGANRVLAVILLLFLVLLLVNIGLRTLEKRLQARAEPDHTERQKP